MCIGCVVFAGKGETQMSTLMEHLRARSLHQASWMETVKVLNTSLSAVSVTDVFTSFLPILVCTIVTIIIIIIIAVQLV